MIHDQKGLTFIEMVTVVAIGAILTVTVFPSLNSHLKNAALKAETKTIASSLQLLRLRAIATNANAYMVFQESNNCWTAYVDSTGDTTQTAAETDEAKMRFQDSCTVPDGRFAGEQFGSGIRFGCAGGVTCGGGVSFVSDTAGFKPSGLPYQAGTIYLKNTVDTSYKIVVSTHTGRIRICRWTGGSWHRFDGTACV